MHNKSLHTASLTLHFTKQDITILTKLAFKKQLAPYVGFVGFGNLGDEILFQAHKKLFPTLNLVPYRKDSMIVEKVADAIQRSYSNHAILGGGTLINRGDQWIYRVEHLLARGTQMFCIGTGVANPSFWGDDDEGRKRLLRWAKALTAFKFVGVRGPYSKALLDTVGVRGIKITGDTALALTDERIKLDQSPGLIAINYGGLPSNLMWGDPLKYRTELIKVINTLIASGHKIILLPIWKNDMPSNKALVQEVNHPNCRIVEAYDSYLNYAEKVRGCELFIGQKLHATIIALMNRIPSIMIEYRPKCRDFMASVNLEDLVIKTSDFTLKDFLIVYERLQKNAINIISTAEARILEYKYMQFKQAEEISLILENER